MYFICFTYHFSISLSVTTQRVFKSCSSTSWWFKMANHVRLLQTVMHDVWQLWPAAGVLNRGRSSMESRENESPPSTSATSDVVSSIRERTIAENSLVVLLQGVQGQVTTVELRDESSARGRVVNVDAFMNIRLEDVDYRDRRGRPSRLQDLFVTGRNIRYVHIPEHMDIMKTIQGQLAKIHRVRNFAREGGGRKEFAKTKKWGTLSPWRFKSENIVLRKLQKNRNNVSHPPTTKTRCPSQNC